MSKLMSVILLSVSLTSAGLAAKCFKEASVEKANEEKNLANYGSKYLGQKPLVDSVGYLFFACAAGFSALVTGAGSRIYYRKKD